VSISEGVVEVEGSGFEEVVAELVEVVAEDCAVADHGCRRARFAEAR
jgi:hypothetical protein